MEKTGAWKGAGNCGRNPCSLRWRRVSVDHRSQRSLGRRCAHFTELLALQERAEVAYTQVVSVTVEPPEVTAAYRAGVGARWTFLSDTDREVQGRLGLLETTDTVHRPFVPTRR